MGKYIFDPERVERQTQKLKDKCRERRERRERNPKGYRDKHIEKSRSKRRRSQELREETMKRKADRRSTMDVLLTPMDAWLCGRLV